MRNEIKSDASAALFPRRFHRNRDFMFRKLFNSGIVRKWSVAETSSLRRRFIDDPSSSLEFRFTPPIGPIRAGLTDSTRVFRTRCRPAAALWNNNNNGSGNASFRSLFRLQAGARRISYVFRHATAIRRGLRGRRRTHLIVNLADVMAVSVYLSKSAIYRAPLRSSRARPLRPSVCAA